MAQRDDTGQIWEDNEEQGSEDELVVTDHRDRDLPNVTPDDEREIETTVSDAGDVLEEYGEDVASSPAERGHAGQ